MTEEQILQDIKMYFDVREFVTERVWDKFGNKSWQFIDMRLLHTILVIRRGIGQPMTINSWWWGGRFTQRGLRTNLVAIVKKMVMRGKLYLSAHVMGKAVDFNVKGMTADEVRAWIIENQDILPYKIRLEHRVLKTGKTITWVHLDVFWYEDYPKIYLFNI